MKNPTIPAMYEQSDGEPSTRKLTEATNELEIKAQGKNFASIKNGKETVDVPRARYVKEIEEKVTAYGRELKKVQVEKRRLQSAVDSMARELASLKKELNNKMDKF
jgi:hypothetical protein